MPLFRFLVLLVLVVLIPARAESLPGCGNGPAAPTCLAGLSPPRIVCVHAGSESGAETVAELPYDGSKALPPSAAPTRLSG